MSYLQLNLQSRIDVLTFKMQAFIFLIVLPFNKEISDGILVFLFIKHFCLKTLDRKVLTKHSFPFLDVLVKNKSLNTVLAWRSSLAFWLLWKFLFWLQVSNDCDLEELCSRQKYNFNQSNQI